MNRVGLPRATDLVREHQEAYDGLQPLNAASDLVPFVRDLLHLALRRFSPPARQKPGKKLYLTESGVDDAAVIYARAAWTRAKPPPTASSILHWRRHATPAQSGRQEPPVGVAAAGFVKAVTEDSISFSKCSAAGSGGSCGTGGVQSVGSGVGDSTP